MKNQILNIIFNRMTSNSRFWITVFFIINTIIIFGQTSQTYNASGTFTIPTGITQVTVEAWGGGASGASNAGRGGGGGAYASSSLTLGLSSYIVTVGLGGNSGGNGGDSFFGSNLVLASGAIGIDGGSATSSIGAVKWNGGSGGTSSGNSGGGGGGSAFTNAVGFNGASPTGGNTGGIGGSGSGKGGDGGGGNDALGLAGTAPGGGGGGGGNKTSAGANGANGRVNISYFAFTSTTASGPVCAGTPSTITVTGTAINLPVGNYTVTYDLGAPNASSGNTVTMSVTTAGTGTFNTVVLNNPGSTPITITSLVRGIYKTSYNNTGLAKNTASIAVALLNTPTAVNNTKNYTGIVNTTSITATLSVGESIDWYTSETGGTLLATNTSSYTPVAVNSGIYSYYAEAVNIASGCKSSRRLVTLTINKVNLTVTAGNQSITYGSNVSTITRNGTYTISGYINGENSGVVNNLGAISYTTTFTSTTNAGSSGINILPVVSGLSATNYNFIAAPGTITISKANQFIDFSPLPSTKPLKEFDILPLEVDASSGLPVTITLGVGSAATLVGGPPYSLTNIGSTGFVTINVTQAGNINYNAATLVSRSFDVTKINQVINFPTITGVTYTSGLTLNLQANATSELDVNYTVVNGPAIVVGNTLTVTGAGSITVKASQAGNAAYNAAADVIRVIVVDKGSQTITINIPSGAITTSSQITATSTSGLPVTLTLGSGSAATALNYNAGGNYYTLSGIGSGLIHIVGNQSGDVNFIPAVQVIQTIDTGKQNQLITFSAISNKTFGDVPIVLNATASSGLTVSYSLVSGPATLISNTLTLTGAGTVIVKADQVGNTTFNPAPSVTQQFEVYKAVPVIAQANIIKTFGEAPFAINPTSTSSGTFSYSSGNTNMFTLSGNTATITGAGTTSLTITQQPTSNYIGVTKVVSFIVNKASSSIVVTGSSVFTFNGEVQGPTTSNVTGSTGEVNYSYSGTGATTYGPSSTRPTNAGTYSAIATLSGDLNYLGATSAPFPFTLSKANAIISVTSYSIIYNGLAQTSSGSAIGVSGESLAGLNFTATTHTNAGTYNNDPWTFTDVTGNYNNASGTVNNIISKKALTITASNKTKTFDGLVFSAFTVDYDGFILGQNQANLGGTLSFSGSAVTAINVGSGYVIQPQGLTSINYAITFVDGTLIITPAPLTIVANNQVKCYGDTFVFNGTEFTSGGLRNGDIMATISLTSTGAGASASAGNYQIIPSNPALNGSFDPNNYDITYNNGNMLVNALPTVNIIGNTTICINDTTTLSPIAGGNWISNNTDIATVTNAGIVTGVSAGFVTFTFINSATGCRNTTSAVEVIVCINKWKGTIDSDWNTPGNWTMNTVLAVDGNLIFDDAPLNHLVLDQDRSVTDITNHQSVYRVLLNGKKLTLKGNLNFTGGAQIEASANNSIMEFAGAAIQSFPASSFYNDEVFNLTINNVNNVLLNGTLRLLNILNTTVGKLDAYITMPTLTYAGSSTQNIDNNQFLDDKIYNLMIDNSVGVQLNTNFSINNALVINPGKKFLVSSQYQLTALGTITNNGGSGGFTLKSDASGTASLIHNATGVPATVQRFISGSKEAWHFLSSPVSNQIIAGSNWVPSGTYGNGTGYDLYVWDEPTPCWVYQPNESTTPNWPTVHPSANFVPGKGYLYSVQATNPTHEFVGSLNNGAISYPITNNSIDEDLKGFNLIGNPYPSSIDWKTSSGWTRSNLLDSGGGYDMWIWNETAGNYGVFNSNSTIGTNGVTQYIAPMQGFFVRAATNGNIEMSNDSRTHNGASNWLRSGVNTSDALKIRVTSLSGKGYDEVLLQFGNQKNEAGAVKLFSTVNTAPSLYLPYQNKELSVRYLTNIKDNSTVPMQFKSGVEGNYKLSLEVNLDNFGKLILEDKKTKTFHNFKENPIYTFKSKENDDSNRFVLHFSFLSTENGIELELEQEIKEPYNIYYDGDFIVVDLTNISYKTEILVVDMLGRKLLHKKFEGSMKHLVSINYKNQILIINATNPAHSIQKKLLIY